MKIRASRLPLAMVCPASTQAAEYDLNSDSEPARLGTAVHEWLSSRIANPQQLEHLGDEAFEQLAVKYSLPVDDVRALSLRAVHLWREVQQWFVNPRIEVAMKKDLGGLQLTGHVDVLSYQEATRTVFVNDHKTGWLDSDHADQVRGYGLMALDEYPEADQVRTCITRVRDFVTDHHTYTRMELVGWSERVVHRLVEEKDTYQPGRHCSFCPRRLTCSAFRDWVMWALEILSGSAVVDLQTAVSADLVTRVYDAKAAIGRMLDDAQEVLKTLAMANGGVLPREDDFQLQLTSQIRQQILFREAWPLLADRVGQDRWNQIFKVSKIELLNAVRSDVGRGEKGKAAQELMAQLEEAGALAETTIERLELRKKPKGVIE